MGRRPVRIKKKERWSTRLSRLFGWHSRVDTVGQQTLDHEAGIFSAVKQNDLPGTLELIDQDPQCLTLRDSVGAAPVHVAFLYGHVELGKQIVLKNRDLASLTYNTLDYTGQLSPYEGENILHIAIVQRRRGLVRWLLEHVPELINAETIGVFFRPSKTCYFGGSPLLFALSSNQIDVAIDVLDAADRLKKLPIPPVRRRTTMSRHHVLVANGLLSKQAMAAVAVAKSGFAVLADAVLGDNWDHENDGDPLFTSIFMCDSYGNNALHLAVLHDLPHVFDFALQRAMQSLSPSHKADNEMPEHLVAFLKRVDDVTHERILSFVRQRNCDELTPLSLAAAVGSTRMFQHILQSLTSVAWSYGPITAINIPLRDLEEPEPRPPFKYKGLVGLFHTMMSTLPYPLVPKGTSGYKTAIQCLCSYERLSCTISKSHADRFQQILANRLEILKLVQINQLFRKKWKFVGKRRFRVRLALYLVFLFTFNTSTLFATNIYDDENVAEWKPIVMGLAEGISFTMAIIKFCNELFQLLFTFKDYTSEVGAGRLDNVCTMMTCICLFISAFMRLIYEDELTDAFAAVALVFAWFYLFFFLLGFRSTGPFVIMILNMIQNDIARFVCVYFAVMAGFSQAIYLVKDGRVGLEKLLHRVRLLLIAGFTGEVDYNDNYTDGRMNPFTQVLMFGYIMLVMILLVNLLIAMMGNTYTEILTDSEHRWVAERANIMAAIENQCSAEQNYEARKKYAIPMVTRGGKEELFLQIETSDVEAWRSQGAQDDEENRKAVDEEVERTVEEEVVQKL